MLLLGKKPARDGAYKLQLNTYKIAAGLPRAPDVFGDLAIYDHGPNAIQWNILGNTTCGDCVFAGFVHQVMLWKASQGQRIPVVPSWVIADYSDATGYKSEDPSTDNGTDLEAGSAYWLKNGISASSPTEKDKIAGYVAVCTDVNSLVEAAYIFGCVGIGIRVPQSAIDQFAEYMPWTVEPNSPNVGGHYVPIIGRNTSGYLLCVTWGRIHAVHPNFVTQYCDEAVVHLSEDWLGTTSKKSPRGLNYEQLQADLLTLKVSNV